MNTKQKLAISMEKLLRTKHLDEITIQEICESCDIYRTTFYRHFKDKYDLVAYIIEQESLEVEKRYNESYALFDEMKKYFDFLYEKKSFSEKAFGYEGQNQLTDVMFKLGVEILLKKAHSLFGDDLSTDLYDSIKFYIAGVTYLCRKWIVGGFKESSAEMAQIACNNIPHKLLEALNSSAESKNQNI